MTPEDRLMKKITIDLEHCYGIKQLKETFDFSRAKACAIYAPNGSMKSSLARTFKDLASNRATVDRIFPTRVTKRQITDEAGALLPAELVLVIEPYDKAVGHTARTSTLLVNATLRTQYERLQRDIDAAKSVFVQGVTQQAQSKLRMDEEFGAAFAADKLKFEVAMGRILAEVTNKDERPEQSLLQAVPYDQLFDSRVVDVLSSADAKAAIKQYIEKYNALLAASTYFKKGVFNYYNAETIADQLAKNGFFEAKHSVSLNAGTSVVITTKKELEAVIAAEKAQITNDADLKKKFAALDKQFEKNVVVRSFSAYLSDNEWLLPLLGNMESLKQEVLVAYARAKIDAYNDLMACITRVADEKAKIAKLAEREETLWEQMIVQFNERFVVPFTLRAVNKSQVVYGGDSMLQLEFVFKDHGGETALIERDNLLQVLSTGEQKAFYILNVLFEIEARRQAGQDTLLIVDDIADSFDYRNKYAIIQYLHEIAEETPFFRQLILTHNFDFFRTIHNRHLVNYPDCYMASKSSAGLALRKAQGFKNVFVEDWKGKFFEDERKRIASIPFMRNLIEFTLGKNDQNYLKLTSLLHMKADTQAITQGDLDAIYNTLFHDSKKAKDPSAIVFDVILREANACLAATHGANFENKIVLSIAIRLVAERYMVKEIADAAFVAAITSSQSGELMKTFVAKHPTKITEIRTLKKVMLMTPDNIHLNSFMYEPILDMSDEHLRALFSEVSALA